MTLPPFTLHRPVTINEATALLDEYGDDAAFYGGGTEMILLMKLGFADYRHLIDLKGLAELCGIQDEGDGLRIGAATTHRTLERSPLVKQRFPALSRMEQGVANLRVRNAGTIGGNLCFSDPHSDPGTFLLAADATVTCCRGAATRNVSVQDFVLGPFQPALEPGELLTEVRVPWLPAGGVMVHLKFSFRERPAATVSCMVRVEDGTVREARVAVGSVGPVPVRATEAEGLLTGISADDPDPSIVEAAARAAAEASGATEDLNGSAAYKRNLVGVMVRRGLTGALAQVASALYRLDPAVSWIC